MTAAGVSLLLSIGIAGVAAGFANRFLYRLIKPRNSLRGFIIYTISLLSVVFLIVVLLGMAIIRFRLFLFQ